MTASLFVSPHKKKGYFCKASRPFFKIAINASCSSICFVIYARQKFFHNALFEFLPGINSEKNAFTGGVCSYHRLLDLKEKTYFRLQLLSFWQLIKKIMATKR